MPTKLTYLLYPDLERFMPEQRAQTLAEAKETPLDTVELVGIGFAVAVTVVLTRYSISGLELPGRIQATIANFVVALPLLFLLGGPFLVRRVRRGLRSRLDQESRR